MYVKILIFSLAGIFVFPFTTSAAAMFVGPQPQVMRLPAFSVDHLLIPPVSFQLTPAPALEEEPTEEIEEEAIQTTYITTANVNLRPDPSTDNPRIRLVSVGTQVEVLDFLDGEWFRVDVNGTEGYMAAEFLMKKPAPLELGEIGAVEIVEWSVARNIIPRNVPLTVIDVRTGLTWQMISFSHGNHADVWPATRECTETMRQAFGRWTWDTRPILLIVGDRTLAASINGMPHGGSNAAVNGFNGHVCMHFVGSRTHNGNRLHEQDHQSSIREAFNTASNW